MKTSFEIKMSENSIGNFRCLLNDEAGRWLANFATKHDQHFSEIHIRTFLFWMLAIVTNSGYEEKIRRKKLIDNCLIRLSNEIKLINDPVIKIRWVLLPRHCWELNTKIFKEDKKLRAHKTSAKMIGDNSRLKKETGWECRIPFEKTLDDLFDYWKTEL